MKDQKKDVWVGVEQLNNDPALAKVSNQEFVELPIVDQLSEESSLEVGASRRDFLKYLGLCSFLYFGLITWLKLSFVF